MALQLLNTLVPTHILKGVMETETNEKSMWSKQLPICDISTDFIQQIRFANLRQKLIPVFIFSKRCGQDNEEHIGMFYYKTQTKVVLALS